MYYWVRLRRNPIVFDFAMGKVCSLPLRVRSVSLSKCKFQHFGIMVQNNREILLVACVNSSLHVYCTDIPPEGGLGTAMLFVGVVGSGVTVNNKGGATCNNGK